MAISKKQGRCIWSCLYVLLLAPLLAPAQRTQVLIPFGNHPWRFNDSGNNFGTAWLSNNFDDGAWSVGTGLFGLETGLPFPYRSIFPQITTPLLLGPAGNVTTTFYFRAYFNLDASNLVNGTVLVSSNFIDDGAVMYLNEALVGRVRVPTGQTATTYATSQPLFEGTNEVITLTPNSLRAGLNVFAVELHQSDQFSSDVIWGSSLAAVIPELPVVTNQPAGLSNFLGFTAVFSVGASGGAITSYVWQKETSPGSGVWGPPNPASQNQPTYTIANAQPSHSGNYRVVVTNPLGSATSAVARLEVYPDNVGPRALKAQPTTLNGVTNRITIRFSELLNAISANQPTNYTLTMYPQTNRIVPISSGIYSASNVILNIAANSAPEIQTNNWYPNSSTNYIVTINNVRDAVGNVIAPNTRVPVWWSTNVPLFAGGGRLWEYHATTGSDPSVFGTPWMQPGYVGSTEWAMGFDPFYAGNGNIITCVGPAQTPVIFQLEPALYRTTFQWPAGLGTSAILRLAFSCDDGLVAFLNGSEILRYNSAQPAGSPVTAGSTASTAGGECRTNSAAFTNLVEGSNLLAVAVLQTLNESSGDMLFSLSASATYEIAWQPLDPPAPNLQMTPTGTNRFLLSWTGGGYALESTTNLLPPANLPAFLAWPEVTNMSNPYPVNNATGPARFFRLRK